jgi:signal transduction histidine kinase
VASGVGLLPEEPLGARLPNRPDTPPGYVLAQGGKPVVVADYASETRFKPPSAYIQHGLVSALGVPLMDKGRVVGALTVRSREAMRFGEDETRFLESLANLLTTILQRTHSEEALRHAQKLESVGQLTGGIAHDFNNLLTIIQGNLQVLEELPAVEADDYAQQLVASAARATGRGAELTSKLLAFSRRQVLQPTAVDIAAMLQSLADMLRRTIDQRIRIAVEVEPGCPRCTADAGQLESALLNIAINARDAMPEGGLLTFIARPCRLLPASLRRELAESLHAPPRDEDFVEIVIGDSGTGMPDAVKERAFEPFFTTKEAGRGTGLGLSTVYGFVKQSKGGVTLDSAPGHGTTITLYIPREQERRADKPDAAQVAAGLPQGLRVLVVEDEPEVLRVVQAFLGAWQCEVTTLRSAEQALALLQAEDARFDLLLSDIVLGAGMRGTELAARARKRRPGLAVLLMSGYASDLLSDDAAEEAVGPALLRKPFTREALAEAIAKVLASPAG